MKIGALAVVVGLALALSASASHAAIVEAIFEGDSATASGSITFPALTGDSDAGVLFSFSGFTQAEITSISWSLDPTTDAVVALDLNALKGDNPCPNGDMDCSNSTLSLSPTRVMTGGSSCSFSADTGMCEQFEGQGDIRFVPVAAPELSTWVMMAVGLTGLGVGGHRAKRRRVAQPVFA
jgi:hypothetical protein